MTALYKLLPSIANAYEITYAALDETTGGIHLLPRIGLGLLGAALTVIAASDLRGHLPEVRSWKKWKMWQKRQFIVLALCSLSLMAVGISFIVNPKGWFFFGVAGMLFLALMFIPCSDMYWNRPGNRMWRRTFLAFCGLAALVIANRIYPS